jgi:hypothetical protein
MPHEPSALRPQDRFDIQQALLRYVRGVDRRNWDLMRSAYHPDAWDDHGNYKGPVDGFVELTIARHQTIEQSMHVLGQTDIEFHGPDGALVETYFITHQRLTPEAGDARLPYLRGQTIAPDQAAETEVIGRYVDRFTRIGGAWRIAHRTVVFEVFRGQPAPAGGGLRPNWALSQRDGNDPVESARRDLKLPPQ